MSDGSDHNRDHKGPLDALVNSVLDVFFFGPVGLAVNCREVVPELAERGREFVDQRVNNARFVGRFAMQQGQREAGSAVTRLVARDPSATASASAAPSASDEPLPAEEHIPVRIEDIAEEGLDTVTWESVGEDELAIPSYASLAASQVVARLEGLTSDELEAVRRYELAHRARKTVLGKIAQLQRS